MDDRGTLSTFELKEMEFSVDISLVFGGLISILLSVVAFFIKQLHRDFRKLEKV